MPILCSTIVGRTDGKAWKIVSIYIDGMDMIEVMWMPQIGESPYPAELLPGVFIREPRFDEQRMVIKHPATITHTVEVLGSMDTQEPRGVQLWAFSKLWSLAPRPTLREMILGLASKKGCERLLEFPSELLFKIGFTSTNELVRMLPGSVP